VILVLKISDVKKTDLMTEKRKGKESVQENVKDETERNEREETERNEREETNGKEKNAKGEIGSSAREGKGKGPRKGGIGEIEKHAFVEREMTIDRVTIENVKRNEGIAIEEMWIMNAKESVVGQGEMITKIEQERKKSRLQLKMEILPQKMCKYFYYIFIYKYATILHRYYFFFYSRPLDIEFEDEEDEDQIIEQRRNRREELLKVLA
jgi:hypothetical protein